jgi:hypothetical protein
VGLRGTIALIFLACSGPPPVAPAAVINATPASVCQGDALRTQIHLDARGSSPQLTLVYTRPDPDAGDITFDWSFSGAVCKNITSDPKVCDVKIDAASTDALGGVTGSDVLFTMQGDRPVDVALKVTNAAGGVTVAQLTVSITPLDDAGACPL